MIFGYDINCLVQDCSIFSALAIDRSHKSHNVCGEYPTMHHFVTEMCTQVHISVAKWCIVGYGTGALWDLCNRSVEILESCTKPSICGILEKAQSNLME